MSGRPWVGASQPPPNKRLHPTPLPAPQLKKPKAEAPASPPELPKLTPRRARRDPGHLFVAQAPQAAWTGHLTWPLAAASGQRA